MTCDRWEDQERLRKCGVVVKLSAFRLTQGSAKPGADRGSVALRIPTRWIHTDNNEAARTGSNASLPVLAKSRLVGVGHLSTVVARISHAITICILLTHVDRVGAVILLVADTIAIGIATANDQVLAFFHADPVGEITARP